MRKLGLTLLKLMLRLELPCTSDLVRRDILWGATCYPFAGYTWKALLTYWQQVREFKRDGWPVM